MRNLVIAVSVILLAACGSDKKDNRKDSPKSQNTGNNTDSTDTSDAALLADPSTAIVGTFVLEEDAATRIRINELLQMQTNLEVPLPNAVRPTPPVFHQLKFDEEKEVYTTFGTYNYVATDALKVDLTLDLYNNGETLDVTMVAEIPFELSGLPVGRLIKCPDLGNVPGDKDPYQGVGQYSKGGSSKTITCVLTPPTRTYVYRFKRQADE